MTFSQLNRTYKLKKFQVKLEPKDFPSGIGNNIYICLNSKSEIDVIDDGMVSPLQYKFVGIDTIDSMEINSKCGNMINSFLRLVI